MNKLPDNIVLPPPPPLRHESSIPQELINNCSENAITEHIRQVKNDFETNNDGAKRRFSGNKERFGYAKCEEIT